MGFREGAARFSLGRATLVAPDPVAPCMGAAEAARSEPLLKANVHYYLQKMIYSIE